MNIALDVNYIVTALAIGAISGGISAVATVAILKTHIDHMREDINRHEQWIHSLSGALGDRQR